MEPAAILCDDARPVSEKRAGNEAAHDILAAEAFALPAADPRLRPEMVFPEDPAGIPEAHDILAAEEFAMPAPEGGSVAARVRAAAPERPPWATLVGVGMLVYWLRRRRTRR